MNKEEMMLLTNKLLIASSAIAVLLVAGSALAETSTKNAQLAEQLADFKSTAFEMRREADTLKSFTPNKRLSWQSHTHRLDALKNHVNKMGKTLAELEASKPTATESQGMAIEQARPHLVSVAHNLTQAIELVNENRNNVHWGEYGEAVSNLYAHADALHTKLDTILDYENAKVRLDRLELQPALAGGS
jgi:septal ring factor EnvC (AmiA/AmiB activator)